MNFTQAFKDEVGELVDVIALSRRSSTPGEAIPETTVQTGIECFLVEKRDEAQAAPVTTKDATYTCYFLEGTAPEVSQIIKRSTGEQLTILTKPRTYDNIIFFECQHQR